MPYSSFVEAFSGYAVPATWSQADFEESNAGRGLDLSRIEQGARFL